MQLQEKLYQSYELRHVQKHLSSNTGLTVNEVLMTSS